MATNESDEVWATISDRSRRAIVLHLAERPHAVRELADALPIRCWQNAGGRDCLTWPPPHAGRSRQQARWEPKSESLLWVADAVCGAIKEYVLHEDGSWLERLESAAVVSELRYRTLG